MQIWTLSIALNGMSVKSKYTKIGNIVELINFNYCLTHEDLQFITVVTVPPICKKQVE